MRIGFVTTSFPRYAGDAAGSFVFSMARAFIRRGHTVDVVAPRPPGPTNGDEKAIRIEGLKQYHAAYAWPQSLEQLFYGAGVPDNLAANPWLAGLIPSAMIALGRQVAANWRTWDAVISHWLLPSAIVAGIVLGRRRHHLAIAHSTDVHLLGALPGRHRLTQWITHNAHHMGFVSPRLRDAFVSYASPSMKQRILTKSSITPMGIDIAELKSPRTREDIRKGFCLGKFTVLYLGRLVPVKGVDLLVEAMGQMRDAELLIAGDGPMRAAIEAQARRVNIKARFLGWVGPRVRADLLKACDVLVLPSRQLPDGRQEGFPITLIEGLAASIPVVASTVAVDPAFLESNACCLVTPPGSSTALGAALAAFRETPDLLKKLKENGKKAAEALDWDTLAPRYERLLGSRRQGGRNLTLTI
ncbi:MAG: glycosyltransferase family 4 protein [Myxococcota bacterium]|nr:glycosyltransferase family 4 protein [Myxococcota bacterium]